MKERVESWSGGLEQGQVFSSLGAKRESVVPGRPCVPCLAFHMD